MKEPGYDMPARCRCGGPDERRGTATSLVEDAKEIVNAADVFLKMLGWTDEEIAALDEEGESE